MIKNKLTPSFCANAKRRGIKLISIATIAMVMAVSLANSASASNLNYTNDATIDLTDADFTIKSGSSAGGIVVNANDMVVTMAAGDYFVVTSATRGMTVTGSVSGVSLGQTCSGSLLDTVTLSSSTGAGNYTIAPSATQCTYASSGGSTGGGAYNPPAATPTPTPTPVPAATATPLPTATPAATATPAPTVAPATPAAVSGVTLYRAEGDSRVYVVKDGKKSWVKSAEEFSAAGYKWSDIKVTAPSIVAALPLAPNGIEGDTTAAATASKVKVVNTSTLRVRQSNTAASSMLGTVKGSETFTVLDQKNGWYKITTPAGVTGWISGAYAAPVETAIAAAPSGATISITVSSLRVRSSNSVAGKVLGSVRKNEKYSVLEENAGWYKIKTSGGITGWVSGAYAAKQ